MEASRGEWGRHDRNLREDPPGGYGNGSGTGFFAPLRAWGQLPLSQSPRGRRTIRAVRKLRDRRDDSRGRGLSVHTPWIKACGAQSDGMHDPVSGSQRGRDPLNLSALSACRHQPGAGERVAVPEPPSQRAALDIRRTKSPEVFSGGRRLDVGDHEAPARPEHPPCLTDGLRLRHTGERARQELAKVATPNNKILQTLTRPIVLRTSASSRASLLRLQPTREFAPSLRRAA